MQETELLVADLLQHGARGHAQAHVVHHLGEASSTSTFSEVADRAARLAGALTDLGVRRDYVVDQIPKTSVGELDKKAVRAEHGSGRSEVVELGAVGRHRGVHVGRSRGGGATEGFLGRRVDDGDRVAGTGPSVTVEVEVLAQVVPRLSPFRERGQA